MENQMPFNEAMFVATLAVSLVFDYTDFARYLLGERDSMI
jgi:hypothetical protein